jgi:hypothetical protein
LATGLSVAATNLYIPTHNFHPAACNDLNNLLAGLHLMLQHLMNAFNKYLNEVNCIADKHLIQAPHQCSIGFQY